MSSTNVMKRENVSASANVLMCKQWWKVCWMYGDQEKYYRQLYAKRAQTDKRQSANTASTQQMSSHYENAPVLNASINTNLNSIGSFLNTLDLTNGINE